jgi:hypothetical protein
MISENVFVETVKNSDHLIKIIVQATEWILITLRFMQSLTAI